MKFPREIIIKILKSKYFNFRKEWLEENLKIIKYDKYQKSWFVSSRGYVFAYEWVKIKKPNYENAKVYCRDGRVLIVEDRWFNLERAAIFKITN